MARGVKVRPFMGSRYTRAHHSSGRTNLQSQFRQNMAGILGALEEFTEGVKGMLPDVLVDALEPTFGKSLEYCPVQDGTLRQSGYLEVEKNRNGSVVALGYGKGGQPDYAIFVHELPYAHEAPTRSKFLEAAVDEDYWQIINSIPRLIRERVGT